MEGKQRRSKNLSSFHYSKEQRTLLDRFVERIRLTFVLFQNKPNSSEMQLAGRIQDLRRTTDSVCAQLKYFQTQLKTHIDEELYSSLESVIEPMLRDIERISKAILQSGTATQQAQAYRRYTQWIDKAKFWIQICSDGEKEVILKAVCEHTIDQFFELIDRDLQVIEDYLEHMLDAQILYVEEKQSLLSKIEKKLEPYMKGLVALKEKPTACSLPELAEWKCKVDKRREKYFDGALHSIDKIIGQVNPELNSEETHEHLVEILTQIAYLEEQIPKLYDEILRSDSVDNFSYDVIFSALSSLDEEIHKLHLDLRLTPELVDRLRVLRNLVLKSKGKLDKRAG